MEYNLKTTINARLRQSQPKMRPHTGRSKEINQPCQVKCSFLTRQLGTGPDASHRRNSKLYSENWTCAREAAKSVFQILEI